jgi:hypothetical protein
LVSQFRDRRCIHHHQANLGLHIKLINVASQLKEFSIENLAQFSQFTRWVSVANFSTPPACQIELEGQQNYISDYQH